MDGKAVGGKVKRRCSIAKSIWNTIPITLAFLKTSESLGNNSPYFFDEQNIVYDLLQDPKRGWWLAGNGGNLFSPHIASLDALNRDGGLDSCLHIVNRPANTSATTCSKEAHSRPPTRPPLLCEGASSLPPSRLPPP